MIALRRLLFVLPLFVANVAIAQQWAEVTMISPTNNQHFSSATITVQYKACSTFRAQSTHTAWVGSTSFTTDVGTPLTVSQAQCDSTIRMKYTASNVTLQPGANTVKGDVCNSQASPTCQIASVTAYYDAVSSVTVTNIGASTIGVGQTTKLVAHTFNGANEVTGMAVTWTSAGGISLSHTSGGNSPDTVVVTGTSASSASATATSYGVSSTASSITVVNPTYSVAVTSLPSTYTVAAGGTSGSMQFRVQNTSSYTTYGPVIFSIAPSCTTVAYNCTVSQSLDTLAEGELSTVFTVQFSVSLIGTSGQVQITASATSPTSFSGSATSAIQPTAVYAVTVIPSPASQTLAQQATSGTASFTVQNTGTNTGSISFSLTAGCGAPISCSSSQGSVALAETQQSSTSVNLTVSPVGTSGSAQLTASATSPTSFSGFGTQTVNTTPYYSVVVTPANASQTLAARATSGSSTFNVKNASWNTGSSIAFNMSASTCSPVASSCSPSPSSLTLAQSDSSNVSISYAVDSINTGGTVALQAAATSPAAFSGIGTTTLVPTPSYTIAVVPASDNRTVGVGSANSYSANIRNTSWNTSQSIAASLSTPGCTNFTLGSCTIAANNNSLAQGTLTPPLTLTYNALSVGNETVALNASGTVPGGTVTPTNGSLAVAVSNSGTITVVTAGKNPGTTIDRGDCLTIAAGQNAAYECGDLRIVHALPTTFTMGKARTPTLIYNSRHAKPGALLAANVTYSGPAPQILQATVTIPGQSAITKNINWNPACDGQPCRIVVPISIDSTWLWAATLQVKAINGINTYATSTSVTDTVITVSRTKSPFGAGWWLAGLESFYIINTTNKLWVGGDGTTRLYKQTADPTVYTVSPAYDRPDTLKQFGSNWRRMLGDGAYVEFDNAGHHLKTRNALAWIDTFTYNQSAPRWPLASIKLPVLGGTARTYTFAYAVVGSDWVLSSVTAPATSFSRVVNTTRNNLQITAITDPDTYVTGFGYNAAGLIATRKNKLSDTTFFYYDDAGALKQATLSMSRTDGAGAAITSTFRAAETSTAASSTDSATVLSRLYTLINGPRSDVGDTTRFYVNRWGAPDSVFNALNMRSIARRENATFSGLVTKSIAPNGFESRAYYNARALMDSSVAVDPFDANCGTHTCDATTKYYWNALLNHADSIVGPTGERTSTLWNAVPTPAWIQNGTNTAQKTTFSYTTSNQVQTITQPGNTLKDSLFYDSFGNLTKTKSPRGFQTDHVRDAIGRDTLALTPTDSLQTQNKKIRTRTKYNVADLVDSTIAIGPAVTYTFHVDPIDNSPVKPDTAFTKYTYDAEGRKTVMVAAGTKELWNPETTPVRVLDQFSYDAAGRVRERYRYPTRDSTWYDAASNVVRFKTQGGGGYTQTFDVLNRAQIRATAARTYARQRCEGMLAGSVTDPNNIQLCLTVFPAFPNGSNGSYVVAADTARFTYDAFGNMTAANNADATVQRGYYRSGAVRADTSTYRAVTNLSFGHQRAIQYHYDLSGRRDTLTLPSLRKIGYSYRPDDGALLTVVDPFSTQYRYVYDVAGRVDSLVIGANSIREKRWYDADGRQYTRQRVRPQGTLSNEVLNFDAQGRVIQAGYYSAATGTTTDTTYITYSGLGAVLARERVQLAPGTRTETEEFRVDGMGNVRRSKTKNGDEHQMMPDTAVYAQRGSLTKRNGLANPQDPYEYSYLLQTFDVDGAQLSSHKIAHYNTTTTTDNPTRNYYDWTGKLRASQHYEPLTNKGTWEEYRYDAFGRRAVVIARPNVYPLPGCTDAGMPFCAGLCSIGDCSSKATWTNWDGDQILREDREAYPGTSCPVPYCGIVEYVHAAEVDKPLASLDDQLTSSRVLNPNWRGVFESSVSPTGTTLDCAIINESCTVKVAYASGQAVYSRPPTYDMGGGSIPVAWAGTLLTDQQDGTGQLYRRNRYFDPQAGRFTSEDPIGLAGGMNLYGFAGGDPITYSDPFGLCPPCSGGELAGAALNIATTAVERFAERSVAGVAAGVVNLVAGNSVGKLMGLPNPVAVNSHNRLQPNNGGWLPASANPGPAGVVAALEQNRTVQFAIGVGQGAMSSVTGVDAAPAISNAQEAGQIVGKLAMEGAKKAIQYYTASPQED